MSGKPSNNQCNGAAVLRVVILLVSIGMSGGLTLPAPVSIVQLNRDSNTADSLLENKVDQLLQLYKEMKLEMSKLNKDTQVQIENLQSIVNTLLSAQRWSQIN